MQDTGFWVPPDQLARLVVYYTTAGIPGMLTPVPFVYTHTDPSKVCIVLYVPARLFLFGMEGLRACMCASSMHFVPQPPNPRTNPHSATTTT